MKKIVSFILIAFFITAHFVTVPKVARAAAALRDSTITTYASRTNTTCTAPTGIQDGDILFIWFISATNPEAPDPTPPSGFASVPGYTVIDVTQSSFNAEAYQYYKVASGESGDYTVTHTAASSQCMMAAISGADTSSPFTPAPTENNGTGGTSTALGLTTSNNDSLVMFVGFDWGDTANNLTAPSGSTPTFTEAEDTAISYMATGVLASAGATGDKTMTNNSTTGAPWGASLVAFNAASASTREQEGFRFRNDDGSETTATWKAAQDTDVTAPSGANTRLRFLINATGDPSSTQYQVEYKKTTDNFWTKATTTDYQPPEYIGKGVASSSAAAITGVPAPAGIESGDLLLLMVESANQAIATPNGWTQVTNSPQFTGTAATAGGVRLGVFYAIATTSAPQVSVADSGNHQYAIMSVYRNVSTTSPIQITAGGVDAAATTAISNPAVTTTAPNTLIVNVIGLDKDLADNDTITTGPTNANLTRFNDRHDATVATGVGGGIAFFTGVKETIGDTGNTTGTADSSTTHAYVTIALNPKTYDILVSPSANITASGDNTTALLTAPSGKTTSDFDAGRMVDDENPSDAVDITADDYTELEWSLMASTTVADSTAYDLRVTANGTALDTYTVTPRWTIGTPIVGSEGFDPTLHINGTLYFNNGANSSGNSTSHDFESGSTQYLSITDGSQTELDLTSDFTMSYWYKPESYNPVNYIFSKFNDDVNQASYRVYTDSTNVNISISNNGSSWTTGSVAHSQSTGTWAHYVIVYTASSGQVKVFKNGAQIGSTLTGFPTSVFNGSASFALGANIAASVSNYMDGLLDEVGVWSSALNDTQAAALYNSGTGEQPADFDVAPVAFWQLNNDRLDYTSNNNDLTANGSPVFSTDVPFANYAGGETSVGGGILIISE